MYKLEDIIQDLKTEKPEVSVWEVIECLEQAQTKVEELEGKIKKAGDILAEHQTMTAPTYLFNAIAALKQGGTGIQDMMAEVEALKTGSK